MCSACITISPVAIEQRGRCVPALLDVRRVRRADEHRSHLLAGRPQGTAQDLERDGIECARSSLARARAFRRPVTSARQPGGTTTVDSGSSQTAGPSISLALASSPRRWWSRSRAAEDGRPRVRARPREAGAAALRPGRFVPCSTRRPDAHQLELRLRIAVAVAFLVRAFEQLRIRAGRRSGAAIVSSNACPR